MIWTRWLGSETRFRLLHLPRGERLAQALRPNPRFSRWSRSVTSCCALGQLSKLLLGTTLSSRPCRFLVWC